jgi:hypothetical protein
MKTKTIPFATLSTLIVALNRKRETAAAAAAASSEVKRLVETLGLPADSVLLRDENRSIEVAAMWNERNVREIPARVDQFHSFKVTKEG